MKEKNMSDANREAFASAIIEFERAAIELAMSKNGEPTERIDKYALKRYELMCLFDAARQTPAPQGEMPELPKTTRSYFVQTCCGHLTPGGDYMGATEMTCCGNPEVEQGDAYTADQMRAYGQACADAEYLKWEARIATMATTPQGARHEGGEREA